MTGVVSWLEAMATATQAAGLAGAWLATLCSGLAGALVGAWATRSAAKEQIMVQAASRRSETVGMYHSVVSKLLTNICNLGLGVRQFQDRGIPIPGYLSEELIRSWEPYAGVMAGDTFLRDSTLGNDVFVLLNRARLVGEDIARSRLELEQAEIHRAEVEEHGSGLPQVEAAGVVTDKQTALRQRYFKAWELRAQAESILVRLDADAGLKSPKRN